jgi:hypothetical protein
MVRLSNDAATPRPAGVIKSAEQFWADFRERALNTFWQGGVTTIIAAPPITDWSVLKTVMVAAIMGGGAAIFSMAKSLAVRKNGIVNSASASSKI